MLLHFLSLLIFIVSLLITWEYLFILLILLCYSESRGQVWTVKERFIFFLFNFLCFKHIANDEWNFLNVLA